MNTLTNVDQAILEEMFREVRETFDSIIGSFYEEQGINIDEVDITDKDYMQDKVDIALQEYSNSNNYVLDFENMELWDDTTDKTKAFGLAIWYITTTSRDRFDEDYNIPVEYFKQYNFNKIRLLFQDLYLSDNRDIVEQTLIYVYKQQLKDEDEDEDEDA